jgi:hypothetical protein
MRNFVILKPKTHTTMVGTQDGALTRTGAYNVIKRALGLPVKRVFVNRQFFDTCFENIDGFYFPRNKKGEEVITNTIITGGIRDLNDKYFTLKHWKDHEEASKVFKEACHIMQRALNK